MPDRRVPKPRPAGVTIVLAVLIFLFALSPIAFLSGVAVKQNSPQSQDEPLAGLILMGAGLLFFALPPQIGFMISVGARWLLMKVVFSLMLATVIAATAWYATERF